MTEQVANDEDFTYEFTAPWGKLSIKESEFFPKVIEYWIKQLKFFKSNGQGAWYIDHDLEGYRYLLENGDRKALTYFMEIKSDFKKRLNGFCHNMMIIDEMKNRGLIK